MENVFKSPDKSISYKKWPSISFFGTVSVGKKMSFASLRINGTDLIMRPGESYNGVLLVALKANGVLVKFCGENRSIITEMEIK